MPSCPVVSLTTHDRKASPAGSGQCNAVRPTIPQRREPKRRRAQRARWEAIRQSFCDSLASLHVQQAFATYRSSHPSVGRFDQPETLVAYLANSQGDADEKNTILAELVTSIQRREALVLTLPLLTLGLWPGLDAAYRRCLQYFRSAPHELVSEVMGHFTNQVERLNFETVSKVAATLVMSTERDVMTERKRLWNEARRERWLRRELRWVPCPRPLADSSKLGCVRGRGFDNEARRLREWLEPIVGRDTDLVMAVTVGDASQHEAGAELGLSHEAARKRFQRAKEKIRHHLARPLSRRHPRIRVSSNIGASTDAGGGSR